MERLILEYSVGDGFTYSGTITVPIVYESAEKAVKDLEEFLIKKALTLTEFHEEKTKAYAKYAKLGKELADLHTFNEKSFSKAPRYEKRIAELEAQMTNWFEVERVELEKKNQELDKFLMGGAKFSAWSFISTGDSYSYEMPRIYTLDEYFKQVESGELADYS